MRRLRRGRATWRLLGSSDDMAPWKIVDRDTPELRAQDPNLQRHGGVYVSNEAWDDYQALKNKDFTTESTEEDQEGERRNFTAETSYLASASSASPR